MSSLPTLMPTKASAESFGGVTYHIDGELVPALSVDVSNMPVYFEHHILLWKNTTIRIQLKALKGMLKRMIAGMQIFVTEASGQGVIAFSRDGPGHIVPIHLKHGEELHVREHQFLAATGNIDYSFERVRGLATMLFGQSGFFIDKFHGHTGEGVLWLHGYGNVFEKVLGPGEQIDIEPGGWLYKDPTVRMDTVVDRLTSGLFGSTVNFVVNRFTGPGRVGIQSMYLHMPSEE
ncbi:MAG TPA: AIM24 family protein [Caulobacteraceae bacterium]